MEPDIKKMFSFMFGIQKTRNTLVQKKQKERTKCSGRTNLFQHLAQI